MKTCLRALLFTAIISLSLSTVSFSQCTISNIVIQNTSVVSSGTNSCTVRFDASFNIENNNGNKFIFIHAWLMQDYPNYFDCVNGHSSHNGTIHAPKSADLGNEFMNIGINNNVDPPTIITTYPPDPSVPMTTVGGLTRIVNPDGSATFILTGITVTIPAPCGTPEVIVADLWSSQSAQAQNAHCVNCGILYSAGYVSLTGLANCATLTYNATVTNHTSSALSGYYRVYADINGDGYFTPAIDTLIQDTTSFSVGAGAGTTSSISGPIPAANRNQDLFILLTQTSGSASGASTVVLIPSTSCAALPVTFQSFRATRMNSTMVNVTWETATEINNSGFAILRNTGGNWEFVAFVPTMAVNGNSNSTLTYSFTDRNNYRGLSQYRIRQVDIDGKMKYTDIRTVRGDADASKVLVYPNPSNNGQVTVVFDDRDGLRDVNLTDNSGRMIQQWKGLSGNTLQVENLRGGIYTLRIMLRETGDLKVEKIVILQ
jgi:hypothetical protein